MASVSAERAAAFGGSLAEGEREDAGQQPPGGGGQHPGQPAGPPQGDRRVAGEQRAVQAGQPGVMGTNRPAVAIQPGTASSGRAVALSTQTAMPCASTSISMRFQTRVSRPMCSGTSSPTPAYNAATMTAVSASAATRRPAAAISQDGSGLR